MQNPDKRRQSFCIVCARTHITRENVPHFVVQASKRQIFLFQFKIANTISQYTVWFIASAPSSVLSFHVSTFCSCVAAAKLTLYIIEPLCISFRV